MNMRYRLFKPTVEEYIQHLIRKYPELNLSGFYPNESALKAFRIDPKARVVDEDRKEFSTFLWLDNDDGFALELTRGSGTLSFLAALHYDRYPTVDGEPIFDYVKSRNMSDEDVHTMLLSEHGITFLLSGGRSVKAIFST